MKNALLFTGVAENYFGSLEVQEYFLFGQHLYPCFSVAFPCPSTRTIIGLLGYSDGLTVGGPLIHLAVDCINCHFFPSSAAIPVPVSSVVCVRLRPASVPSCRVRSRRGIPFLLLFVSHRAIDIRKDERWAPPPLSDRQSLLLRTVSASLLLRPGGINFPAQ